MNDVTRIERTFTALKQQQKTALIPYIMAGDPAPDTTVALMHQLAAAGADIIELGLPFSDPMADGEMIAKAGERALASGTSTRQALEMVKTFRQTNQSTPVLVMGYLNPLEVIGYEVFADLCAQAGIDGVLLVDLPPDEAGILPQLLAQRGINQIFLLAPTTTCTRRQSVLAHGSGFIYYVALKGVTGASYLDAAAAATHVQAIKADTALPVCVGFGVKDPKDAAALAHFADGVIVGSALVRCFADVGTDEQKQAAACAKITAMVQAFRRAIDGV